MDQPLIHFDKRIADRSIKKGLVSQEEYDAFLRALPDSAEKAEVLDLEEEERQAAARSEALRRTAEPAEAEAAEATLEGAPAEPAGEAPAAAAPEETERVDSPGEDA